MSLASYDEAVTGWASHLRAGGTTTWSAWLAAPDADLSTGGTSRPLPDAVHLELVRLLNQAAGRPLTGLAERVLATGSPGRGLVDVPLSWPTRTRGYGAPAMDPEQVPREELIRLAVGLLVHLLPGVPRARGREPAPAWPLPWRRRFLLHGSPATAAAVRRGLLEQGLVETDWRPTHVVIARSVEAMMAERWAVSAQHGGILKWSTLWRRDVATGHLPGPVDVAAIAARLADRPREPLHVVIAHDPQQAAETVARLLRARPFAVAGPAELAHTDLLRRVNRLTALAAGPDRVRDLGSRLTAVLDGTARPEAPPPGAPEAARDWARRQATRAAQDLRSAGYAVHGDPHDLVTPDRPRPGTVDRARTLELAIAACLRTWSLQGGRL